MKNSLCAIILFFIFQSTNAQIFNANLASRLQTTLDSLVTLFANTKGMSASVHYPGQGIWKGASGQSYAGQPVTVNMEFGLASNSKLFTSVAMLILAENNIIHLEDSLHEWIPSYPNINPNITIRQLLNHTSGISDPFTAGSLIDSIESNPTHVYTPVEVLSYVGVPVNNPGIAYTYSNINYILAGMVDESATGFHISQIIRDSILTPLALDSTFYDVEEPISGTIAHRWYNGVDFHDTSRVSLNTAGGASGSIFSTSGEMVQWYNALMSGQVLSAASMAEMTTFVVPGNYGLGIALSTFFGNTCWGHGGSTLGYKTRMIYDPCMKATVCGLSNSNPSAVDGITALLYKVLVDYLPDCAGAINGIATVCQGQNAVTYSVPPITNATSYIWTLPAGATGASNTNSITINYGLAAVSGTVTVKGTNSYGDGAPSSLPILVNNVSSSTTNVSICSNQTPYIWNGQNLDTSGIYNSLFTNANGCDSVATLNLTVDTCGTCYTNLTINSTPFTDSLSQSQTWIVTLGTVLIPSGANVKLDADTSGYILLNPDFRAESGSVFVAQVFNGCTPGAPQLPELGKIMPALQASNEIVLFPNPTTGMIHIKHNENIKYIQIFDMVGKLIINQKCEGELETPIDLSNFHNGVYHVKAAGHNSIKVVKSK